jgi:hypothetical protein
MEFYSRVRTCSLFAAARELPIVTTYAFAFIAVMLAIETFLVQPLERHGPSEGVTGAIALPWALRGAGRLSGNATRRCGVTSQFRSMRRVASTVLKRLGRVLGHP